MITLKFKCKFHLAFFYFAALRMNTQNSGEYGSKEEKQY